ncbi:siroheme synthase [Vibrio sp. SM6]|uniref:precorrin-2 dehydrogenase n=1 Tax=Vibrio agarilyticus TaxID=2726741 RepID=A0A7X8TPF7_9VIBR|nr:bifunctional precorrin-2 dehydrogenase/sirohydrochlorin ferrochelatase [Vibrio agarilyticus]NLS12537.1 siroheme synthase [Vibrio agarilyticus]
MQYFPIFLNLVDKPVMVVGGGEVASRKIDALVKAGADVTIISPSLNPELEQRVGREECHWIKAFYSSELMSQDYWQVWATTDNPALNHRVYADAKRRGILVNVVDDKPYCDFITPSMINRGRIQLAISSGGAAPVLIRNMRETLESILPQNLGILAEFADSKRNAIKVVFGSVDERRKFWERFFAHPQVSLLTNNHDLEHLYQATLAQDYEDCGNRTWIRCGDDVEMLPIKALRFMQQAESVFYHEGANPGYLELVRRDAERFEFKAAVELAQWLKTASDNKQRVCVLIPESSTEYRLLMQEDLVF